MAGAVESNPQEEEECCGAFSRDVGVGVIVDGNSLGDAFAEKRSKHTGDANKHEVSSAETIKEQRANGVAANRHDDPESQKQQRHIPSHSERGKDDCSVIGDDEVSGHLISPEQKDSNQSPLPVAWSSDQLVPCGVLLDRQVGLGLLANLVKLPVGDGVIVTIFQGMQAA